MYKSSGMLCLLACVVIVVAVASASRLMEGTHQAQLEAVRADEASSQPNPEIERQKRLADMGADAPEEYLIGRLRHRDPFVRLRSVLYLRQHRTQAALEAALAALNDDTAMVRRAAVDSLLQWPNDDVLVVLMNVVQLDREKEIRYHAVEILRKFPPNPRVLSFLAETANHSDSTLRILAFAGLDEYARSMPAEWRTVCLRWLDTSIPETTRKITSRLLNSCRNEAQVRQGLVQAMRRGNSAVTTVAFELLSRDNPRDVELMVSALHKCGDLEMAQAMLDSRHPKLSEAARTWAHVHGVPIVNGPGRTILVIGRPVPRPASVP